MDFWMTSGMNNCSPFYKRYRFVIDLTVMAFCSFFESYLEQKKTGNSKFKFLASIAFLFQDLLKQAGSGYYLNMNKVIQSSFESLTNYHQDHG